MPYSHSHGARWEGTLKEGKTEKLAAARPPLRVFILGEGLGEVKLE